MATVRETTKHPAVEHHAQAAEHHREAAKHHEEAARLHTAGNDLAAAEAAYRAYGHGSAAQHYSVEAAKAHAGHPSTMK
jgi:hypothetical protein